MAKLVLTIQPKDEGALKSIQALKAEVQSLSKSLSSITVNKDLTAQINALTRHYTALVKAQEKVISNNNKQAISDEKLSQQQAITAKKVAEAAAAQARLEKAQQKTTTTTEQLQRKFANLLSTIKSLKSSYPQGTFDEMEQGVRENLQATKDGTKSVENLSVAYDTLSTKVAVAKAETDKVTTAVVKSGDSIASLAKKFLLWQVTATLVMKPLRLIQDMLSSIDDTLVKTEDAVIALQRVLPTGSATDDEISGKVYDIAQRYGQTFENVSQIATNFARTGMSWADTIKATEAAVLALNVAELDAEEATTGLIAILSQFNLEASDLETVIDKLNKTADNFPVTTEKILAALQRTGSAASNANLTLDQTIALITALSKATGRSGENIGTALNSLIQYSSKSSALDTFAGLSEQSAAVVAQFRQGGANILDVWRQVSEEIQHLKSDQADLLDQYFATEDGEALKDALDGELEDIYTELGGVYDTANTFRKNYFIALLGNMDTVEQAMGTLGDAAGYSQAENEKYLDTYTAKLNSLKAQWEDLANSEQGILGLKKFFVDVGSAILTATKWTGGLTTALLAAGTAIMTAFGGKIVEKITSFNSKLSSGTLAIRKNFGDLINAQLNASLANDQLTIAQERLNLAKQKGIGIVEAEAAVTKAETAVTEANTAVKKAQAAAIGSVLTYAMLAVTVISAVVGAIRQWNEEQKKLEEERRNAAQSSIREVNDTISALNEYIDKLDELKLKQAEGKDVTAELAKVQDELKKKYEGVAEAIGKSNNKLKNNIDLTSEAARQAAIEDALRWRLENDEAIKTATENVEGATQDRSSRATDNNHHLANVLTKAGFGDYVDAFTAHGQMGSEHEGFRFSFAGTKDEIIKQIEDINAYLNENGVGIGVSQEDLELLREMLSAAYNRVNTEAYKADKEIYEYNQKIEKLLNGGSLAEFLGIEQKVTTETAKQTNNIQDQVDKYDDLIKKLEELRDAQKESLDLEEKKKAVLEAQKALENARNEATVRRFNEATGQWEWQTDEKAIAEAEENLEKARQNLEEQAYDSIIKLLQDKTATNDGLNAILDGLKKYLGEEFIRGIKDAILGGTNVDLDKPVNDGSTPSGSVPQGSSSSGSGSGGGRGGVVSQKRLYDKGGIANGVGVMAKGTKKPETVVGPDLTKEILSPVSNEHFHRWVRDQGVLFETARQYTQTPVIERVGGTTDNRVDNSGQIIFGGGLTVSADKRSSSIDDLLALGGIVPNI